MSTVFPKWTNHLPTLLAGGAVGGLVLVVGVVWYYFTPKFWRTGYMPNQPALTQASADRLMTEALKAGQTPTLPGREFPGFSHQIHAGKLGMDCRYCHSHVEESAEANIPSASTCMGCHAEGHLNDLMYAKAMNVKFIREAWENNESIEWRRVHKLPDYVRNFPHNVHINSGVSCFSCHGNIMEQKVVHEAHELSMSWCLGCHANPTPNLVPRDKVTDLYWVRDQIEKRGNAPYTAQASVPLDEKSEGGAALLKKLEDKPLHLLPNNCGACHF